jgi:hypothetical protein
MARILTIVIFSKDRACQLDSLLRSIRDNGRGPCTGITVLYRATTAAFAAGYDVCMRRDIIDNVEWRQEKIFQDDVRDIVGRMDDDSLVMFLVDDTIMFRPCVLGKVIDAFTEKHLFVSVRTSRTYPSDTQPEFLKTGEFLEWKWNYSRRKWVTWNYPFSVDGNIFHACHMKKVVKKVVFSAPNSFEGRMHTYRHAWWIKRISLALALPEAAVFNNPLNRVQSEGETWHENIAAEYLNDRYLSWMQIDNSVLYSATPIATHYAVPLSFVQK